MLWIPVLCVCIFESINTQRYLNREKAHCRNRHHRDILIITLFVGDHAPLFLRSIHSLRLPSDLPLLPSLFQFSFTFFTFRLMSLSENPLSRDSLKRKRIFTMCKSSFAFPCDEREIRLSSRNDHESSSSFIKNASRRESGRTRREQCVHTRWREVALLSRRNHYIAKNETHPELTF